MFKNYLNFIDTYWDMTPIKSEENRVKYNTYIYCFCKVGKLKNHFVNNSTLIHLQV